MHPYFTVSWGIAALLGLGLALTFGMIEIRPMPWLNQPRRARARRQVQPAIPAKADDLLVLSQADFEQRVKGLLVRQGYKQVSAAVVRRSSVDFQAEKDGLRHAIRISGDAGELRWYDIVDLAVSKNYRGCQRCLIITRGRFSRQARKMAPASDCVLVDRRELERWVSEEQPLGLAQR